MTTIYLSLLLLLLLVSLANAWIHPATTVSSRRQRMTTTTTTITTRMAQSSSEQQDYTGKTLYQRIFYRFTPGSDVAVHDSVVLEERVRFQADPENPGYLVPVGHRTLVLRDGQVEEGEIGNDFFTLSVDTGSGGIGKATATHTGAGTDRMLESEIATALYLASNPNMCTGKVLQVACESGVGALLGCIGANFVLQRNQPEGPKLAKKEDLADDILTIATHKDDLLPKDLEKLTLTALDDQHLNAVFHNCKHSGVSPAQVSAEPLDWTRERPIGRRVEEFTTVVASDVTFTYPEAKALARTVAHRLAPAWFPDHPAGLTKAKAVPRMVHIGPATRDDVAYLQRFLSAGYKMTVYTGYLKLEKLKFQLQLLPDTEPETALDELELELLDLKEITYTNLLAQHHPDYAGEGSGELFFPMETGEYDARSGSTFLEPDTDTASPW